MRWTPERRRALRSLVGLLRRGIATEADADELVELVLEALSVTGLVLAEGWSYTGWGRVVGLEESWGRAYEPLKHQDPSRDILLSEPPGSFWFLRRDGDEELFATDLQRAFTAHELYDSAVFRLPSAYLGNIAGGFYRHRGLPAYGEEDELLFSLLYPHLRAGLAARRALAAIGGAPSKSTAALAHAYLSLPAGTVEWSRRARELLQRRLGQIGPRGWTRLERALWTALRQLDRAGIAEASQPLARRLRVELANVPPQRGESRRVMVLFIDETLESVAATGETTPAEELLSPRQRQIARLAARGDSASEIASHLGIGESTVRHHLRAIYRRLGVERRGELAALIREPC